MILKNYWQIKVPVSVSLYVIEPNVLLRRLVFHNTHIYIYLCIFFRKICVTHFPMVWYQMTQCILKVPTIMSDVSVFLFFDVCAACTSIDINSKRNTTMNNAFVYLTSIGTISDKNWNCSNRFLFERSSLRNQFSFGICIRHTLAAYTIVCMRLGDVCRRKNGDVFDLFLLNFESDTVFR